MHRLVLTFAIIAVVYIVIGHHERAEAQQPGSHKDAENNIEKQSQPRQKNRPCQERRNQPGPKNKRRKIYKPERNKLQGGKGKKKSIAAKKRKKSGKQKIPATKKSKLNTMDGETAIQGAGKNNEKRVKIRKMERVDDIPILINVAVKAGIQHAIDKYIPVQKNQRDLSWGRTTVIWLAYILTTGDHRKVAVQEYIKAMEDTLTELVGTSVTEKDFSDDRLSVLAGYLSEEKYWNPIEQGISENTIDVYTLAPETVRLDATTVSGYHETIEGELFQFGHSKDDPDRPQIKIMTGSLDPLGMPLASDVVSGEKADDGLYSPIVRRIAKMLQQKDLLYVGDCKLSSFENRLYIKAKAEGSYLCPLPNTGKTPKNMEVWIAQARRKDEQDELTKYIVTNEKGQKELRAKGYEIERMQSGEAAGKKIEWTERVLIVKSPAHEQQQKKGLETRLRKAEEKLLSLTPARGRGKRQIKEKSDLVEKAESILKRYAVRELLDYTYKREMEKKTKYVGRGRGGPNREKRVEKKIRYQITNVIRNEEKIAEKKRRCGWKAFVTDVSRERLGFVDIVKTYRKQYRVERIFNRLKSRLNIAPLFVKRKDQIKGMTHLLMLAVRVHTLVEFVVRRSLSETGRKLVGLYPGNRRKATADPTCERILKEFSNINLTILEVGNSVERHLTPLSKIQIEILSHLGFTPAVYADLEKINENRNLKLE